MTEIPEVSKMAEVSEMQGLCEIPEVTKVTEVSEILEVSETTVSDHVPTEYTGLYLVSYEPILKCSNCDKVKDIRKSKMYQCASHRCQKFFCDKCAKKFEMRCPTPSHQFHKPSLTLIHFSEPRYQCNYRSLGCQASLKLSEISLHEETCVFTPTQMYWSG